MPHGQGQQPQHPPPKGVMVLVEAIPGPKKKGRWDCSLCDMHPVGTIGAAKSHSSKQHKGIPFRHLTGEERPLPMPHLLAYLSYREAQKRWCQRSRQKHVRRSASTGTWPAACLPACLPACLLHPPCRRRFHLPACLLVCWMVGRRQAVAGVVLLLSQWRHMRVRGRRRQGGGSREGRGGLLVRWS